MTTTKTEVTVLLKDTNRFDPYQDGEPLRVAAHLRYRLHEGMGPTELLTWTWETGNKMAPDGEGNWYPSDQRSLSVGDVVVIRVDAPVIPRAYAVERFGWRELDLDSVDAATTVGA